jgi:hypothetical protein
MQNSMARCAITLVITTPVIGTHRIKTYGIETNVIGAHGITVRDAAIRWQRPNGNASSRSGLRRQRQS